jgi:hypothetical protein
VSGGQDAEGMQASGDWPPRGRNGAPPVTNAAVFTTVFRHEAGGD